MALMADLFRKHIPLLYSITAFIACFAVVNADKITLIVGGSKFKEAALAVCIMSFYPIHQTYGQLSGAVFFATGQTKLYRNISTVFMLLGLPVTYFLIAPRSGMGLDAGSAGLAIKMVAIQLVAVNVQLYYNAKFLRLDFWKYIVHQISVVVLFLVSAACVRFVIYKLLDGHANIIVSFMASGALYLICVGIIVYWKPIVLGAKRQDIAEVFNLFFTKLKARSLAER